MKWGNFMVNISLFFIYSLKPQLLKGLPLSVMTLYGSPGVENIFVNASNVGPVAVMLVISTSGNRENWSTTTRR